MRPPGMACGTNSPGTAPFRPEVLSELLVQERQPERLRLVDDRHPYLVDQRQLAALQACQQRLALGVVGRGLGVIELVAEVGTALQHDQRAAAPLLEPERAAAHRVRVDLVAVVLHHLARLGAPAGRSWRWSRRSAGAPP
jgi:hypothetical protein